MKTAIVTLIGNYNYGNRLQNYAMNYILQGLGHSVETLVFPEKPDLSFGHLKYKLNVLLGRVKDPVKSMTPERLRRFEDFNKNIPMKEVGRDYTSLNDEFDFFIVGSDQVWNPEFLKDDEAFFLRFAEESKRIAVSASFGVEEIPAREGARFASGLKGIPNISTREESGLAIIQKLTGRDDAVCVVDPTLVLSGEDWRAVASYDLAPKDKYIFSYMLGSITSEQESFLERLSEDIAADIILLSDRDDRTQLPAGPADFVGLIDNASAIATNSFHGAALSCLLRKPLFVMSRGGNDPTFSRLQNLSDKLGLGLDSSAYQSGVAASASYQYIEARLSFEREHFYRFLESAGISSTC